MSRQEQPRKDRPAHAGVGLHDVHAEVEEALRRLGLDIHRLSVFRFGRTPEMLWRGRPPWFRRLAIGTLLWAVVSSLDALQAPPPPVLDVWISLLIGLIILQAACDALITGTERLAARRRWDHYIAGTVAEILSTLPEFVVIAFVIPVSPVAAVIIALATIYNNALVFSLYSYFLPKNKKGLFLMPVAITEAGTQLLIAGAAMGSILGLTMITLAAHGSGKQSFASGDLILLGLIMWGVFGVYAYKLVRDYAEEEGRVHRALQFGDRDVAERKALIYESVRQVSPLNIASVFSVGIGAAFLGGERVSAFAETAIGDLGLNEIATAVILAGFAGMSEYVILWRAHRKGQHRIALANAFGGITQVMFLVLPFTLVSIGVYQLWTDTPHPELPLPFDVSLVMLTSLLFPTFYALTALLEEDHTLGILDTAIMTAVCSLILVILLVYG